MAGITASKELTRKKNIENITVIEEFNEEVSSDEKYGSSSAMKILAAIPCYNEEIAIGSVVLKAKNFVDTIIVVDDGSSDDTALIAKEAGATVISHTKNGGKGGAIKTALKYASEHEFDALVLLDGDGQHNPSDIPSLLEPLTENSADMVIGYRSLGQMPFYRRIGRIVLDKVTGAKSIVTDSQCGFRVLNRRTIEALLKKIKTNGFSIESEMLMKAHELGLRIEEREIFCKYGDFDTSTENPVKHGFAVLGSIIQMIVERRPLTYIGIPGLGLILIGFFFGLQLMQLYNQSGYFSLPLTMLSGFFLILGTFGVFMGILLNVISRLTERDKNILEDLHQILNRT
ncbi:MAG: glycosyl transferase family 2 [Candidatus Syntrophoarchaeum caldarius]|uniref:Glycosyl transferase family 2 n=1 Tax=Candidatus Syntropharchaeum caldarium TaxID=1838285 RepID=A0A1F2PAH5_9EURY|nr:MAG: glycosyl transferase family 2 [Candidatus Syntrophoarchaeum caldarius]